MSTAVTWLFGVASVVFGSLSLFAALNAAGEDRAANNEVTSRSRRIRLARASALWKACGMYGMIGVGFGVCAGLAWITGALLP